MIGSYTMKNAILSILALLALVVIFVIVTHKKVEMNPESTTSAPTQAVAEEPSAEPTSPTSQVEETAKETAEETTAEKVEETGTTPTPIEKAIEEAKKELPVGVLEPMINKVQENYDKMVDLEVSVTQTVKKLLKPKPTISSGTIKVIKPNKIFWLTTSPELLKTVADGTTIWVYDPTNKQVFLQSQAESNNQTKIAMLFLSGKGKLTDEFIIGSKKGNLFEWKMMPKDEPIAQVKSIEASINRTTHWFDSLTIQYTYDETVKLEFKDYKINQGLAEQNKSRSLDPNISPEFKIQVPPGTKIIKSPI